MPTFIPNAPRAFPGDETPDIDAILLQVKNACAAHARATERACELQEWYDGNSEKFIRFRPSEDAISWLVRPKRVSFITGQAINKLTSHLYKPGPRARRVVKDPDVSAWYGRVAQDIQLNGVMQQADRLATLHGLCAIGVYPTDVPTRPINYHLYPRQDFCFWASPRDPRVATAVCTITRTGPETVRYQLWTASHYYTFFKAKAWGYVPGGAAPARYDPGASGPHGYGVLPFAFVTHELPTTDLETPGLGGKLAKINRSLNEDKSNLASWIHHYARPLGIASGVPPEWRPRTVDGSFLVLPPVRDSTEMGAPQPDARYLESALDITALREYIRGEANAALAEIDVPITVVSQTDGGGGAMAQSGLAVAALDADLITYAKGRQPLFELHESRLFALVCRVAASAGDGAGEAPEKLHAAADDPSLRVSWAEPSIDLPGQARDVADQWELDNGLTDPIEVLMHRRGLTEDEAIEAYRATCRRKRVALALLADPEAEVADPTPDAAPTPPGRDADGERVDAVAPDMGIEPAKAPSEMAEPETSVMPSVSMVVVTSPSEPIPAGPILGLGRGGSEA